MIDDRFCFIVLQGMNSLASGLHAEKMLKESSTCWSQSRSSRSLFSLKEKRVE